MRCLPPPQHLNEQILTANRRPRLEWRLSTKLAVRPQAGHLNERQFTPPATQKRTGRLPEKFQTGAGSAIPLGAT